MRTATLLCLSAFLLPGQVKITPGPEKIAIELARALDQNRRDANAFLIDLARQRHGTRTHAAHIRVMRTIIREYRRPGVARGGQARGGECSAELPRSGPGGDGTAQGRLVRVALGQ